MPDKLRHDKGKHPSKSKKRRERQRSQVTVAYQPVAAQTSKPAVPTDMPAPRAKVPAPSAASRVARYPYITTELRRIGILAGIIIAILVVLALILS
ncbi:hypothetical protein ACFLUZ_02390 [Chloroflexota bacterium]